MKPEKTTASLDEPEDFDGGKNNDCPNCGREYDDADADFLICHHCHWNENTKRFTKGGRQKPFARFGIDPDVELDSW